MRQICYHKQFAILKVCFHLSVHIGELFTLGERYFPLSFAGRANSQCSANRSSFCLVLPFGFRPSWHGWFLVIVHGRRRVVYTVSCLKDKFILQPSRENCAALPICTQYTGTMGEKLN